MHVTPGRVIRVSVLFNESKLLKSLDYNTSATDREVSVLFNESKLLKFGFDAAIWYRRNGFSTLQRVEIAEIWSGIEDEVIEHRFSTLQRVEIAEIWRARTDMKALFRFSTLQRVEIAEIDEFPASSLDETRFQYSSTSRNC